MRLYELTAAELAGLMVSRQVSAVEICEDFLARSEAVEPLVGAFITRCPNRAMRAAQAVDDKRAESERLAPLAGVPIAVKDNICISGLGTTCSSAMLKDFVPFYTAFAAERAERAGMVVLGKTNLDEFGMGSTCETARLQSTKNPHDLGCVPGGSSGGSAACVASGQAPLALGSDTGGSIRCPASYCGVVGLRPTYGSVSRYGLVAMASSLDQIGPMGRSVLDVALLFDTIRGIDERDATSLASPYGCVADALEGGIKGLRIGLPREFFDVVSPQERDRVREAAVAFERMGAHLVELSLPTTRHALAIYLALSTAEASSDLARFDGVRYGHRTEHFETLSQLYERSRAEGFGPEVKRRVMLGAYVLSSGENYYERAVSARRTLRAEFSGAFEVCDLILTPSTPTVAPRREEMGDPVKVYGGDSCLVSVNLAGLCAVSVMCGTVGTLPVGMQLIGDAWQEPALLRAAYAYEQFAGGPRPVARRV